MMGNFFLIADEAGLGKTTIANEIINRAAEQKNGSFRVIYVASNSRIARKNMGEFLDYDPNQIKNFQKETAIKAVEAMYGSNYEYRTKKRKGLNCFEAYKTKIEGFPNLTERVDYQGDRLSMFHKSGIYSDSKSKDDFPFVVSLSPKTSFLDGYMDLSGKDAERREMKYALRRLYQEDGKTRERDKTHEIDAALKYAIEYENSLDKEKKYSETWALSYCARRKNVL